MADRYDLAKDYNPPEPEKPQPKPFDIWPMEVRLAYEAVGAYWYVLIRHIETDDDETWKVVKRKVNHTNGTYNLQDVTFENRDNAEQWCHDRGLDNAIGG